MSNLLERAIIDANALREAALRSAEKLVIEKYSEEVKEAIDTMIEQEIGGDPLAQGMGGEDPMMDLGMEPTGDDPMADLDDDAEAEETLDPESVIGGLPDAFSTKGDDEMISIKLDSLDAEYDDESAGIFGGDDELSDDEIGIDILDDEAELDTDEEVEFDLEDDTEEESELNVSDDIGIDLTSDVVQEALSELGIDAEEEGIDVQELIEKVRVDFEPVKSGWAGTPESIMREYESMLLAREQDSEVKEENEELRKNVAALQKENKTLMSAANKLQMRTEKYETAFNTLQEKLETMNVSNAKLLYINQALENASLNERQKRKLVEAISKAGTVQEAKIVFDTMSETVTTTSDVRRDETLNEVVSRRSSLLVAARNEQPNKDANPLYNRMQKLAGIKTQ